MSTYARVDNVEKIEKERCIESHINDLLNGYVQSVNEDADRNINISVGEVEKNRPLSEYTIKEYFPKGRRKNRACKAK